MGTDKLVCFCVCTVHLHSSFLPGDQRGEEFEEIVDNLNATEDRKPRKKSKSSSKNWDLSLKGRFLVLADLVEQGRVKVDLDQDQARVAVVFHWDGKISLNYF